MSFTSAGLSHTETLPRAGMGSHLPCWKVILSSPRTDGQEGRPQQGCDQGKSGITLAALGEWVKWWLEGPEGELEAGGSGMEGHWSCLHLRSPRQSQGMCCSAWG